LLIPWIPVRPPQVLGPAPEAAADPENALRRAYAHIAAPLQRAGLPHEPLPTVPPEDRAQLDLDALLRASVALDVLATAVAGLAPSATMLSELVAAAVYIGGLSGRDAGDYADLLQTVAGPLGAQRAQLHRHLAEVMNDAALPCSPAGLRFALTDLARAADAAICACTLLLQTTQEPRLHQG
jgi:hypothetical protein